MVTINVKGLNTPIKRQKLAIVDNKKKKKKGPTTCYLQESHFNVKI